MHLWVRLMDGTTAEAATLSEDGTTITWKILSDRSQPGNGRWLPVFR